MMPVCLDLRARTVTAITMILVTYEGKPLVGGTCVVTVNPDPASDVDLRGEKTMIM